MHVIFFFLLHEIINKPKTGTATVNYSDSTEEWMSHQFTTFFVFRSVHINRWGRVCVGGGVDSHTQYSLETVSNRN